ncbi:helix-turn-helix transcriptional regulator [Victivallis sp. Marseille-Q1083]|uniref:helix-turn-helix domain-containing protein n=1 Tax=Victivallis sp. Marseille-Q1083 TaxID=2717288 RepID=UPI00158D603A|nr:helix-turn-helix transcriptional regulator [Victivallis sp. Marseille-Q1083]
MKDEQPAKKFPSMLKSVINKYNLKNVSLANELGVTSQYISKILSGKCLPSRDQIEKILSYLDHNNVPNSEQRALASSFVEDKTGFFYEIADLELTAKNQLEKKLLTDFRMLSIEGQKKTLAYINQLLIESL